MSKQILIKADYAVNYIYHLLSVSNIGISGDYSVLYESSVNKESVLYLQKNRELLSFHEGNYGELFNVLVTLPCYLSPVDNEEFGKYSYLITESIKKQDITDFELYYNERYMNFSKWQGFSTESYILSLEDYSDIIKNVCDIYFNNYNTYIKDVWNIQKSGIQKKCTDLNLLLEGFELIQKWEEETGFEYEFESFESVPVSSLKKNDEGMLIGCDKSIISSESDMEKSINNISRHFGYTLLKDILTMQLNQRKFPVKEIFEVYEIIIRTLNSKITGIIDINENIVDIEEFENLKNKQDYFDFFENIIIKYLS